METIKKHSPKTTVFLFLCLIVGLPLNALAQELPGKLKAALLIKLLSFDRKLVERSPDGIRIGLLGSSGSGGETGPFLDMNGKKSQGKTIQIISLLDTPPAELVNKLNSAKVNALYVMAGTAQKDVQAIATYAQKNGVATFGGSRSLVEQGLAVGFDSLNGKPKIFVNPNTTKVHGMQLPSRVLRLAKLIQ